MESQKIFCCAVPEYKNARYLSGHCKVFTGVKLEAYTVWYEAIHTKGFDYLLTNLNQAREERGNRLHLLPWSSLSRVAIEGHGMVALAALVVAAACNHCQQPVDTTTVAPRQCQLDIQGSHMRFHRS